MSEKWTTEKPTEAGWTVDNPPTYERAANYLLGKVMGDGDSSGLVAVKVLMDKVSELQSHFKRIDLTPQEGE